MRGFDGVVRGIEKALPIFHDQGLYPSVNLGLNRNLTPDTQAQAPPHRDALSSPEDSGFYRAFKTGFDRFYTRVIDMGFTIANACYPMNMADDGDKNGLDAVYAAASPDRVVRFTRTEKALLFKALKNTIPGFRSKIRIFSPLTALHTLVRDYTRGPAGSQAYPCRGGIDFFYINCTDGNTYPCGYRGRDNLGPFESLEIPNLDAGAHCLSCDWECFRDPTELGGPVLEGLSKPWRLVSRAVHDPEWGRLWLKDLRYYRACGFFNGRVRPDPAALSKF